MGLYESAFNSLMEYRGHRPKLLLQQQQLEIIKNSQKDYLKKCYCFPASSN